MQKKTQHQEKDQEEEQGNGAGDTQTTPSIGENRKEHSKERSMHKKREESLKGSNNPSLNSRILEIR